MAGALEGAGGEPMRLHVLAVVLVTAGIAPVKTTKPGVEDDTLTVAGHAFACKKISFTQTNEKYGIKGEIAVWVSADAKGSGVVRYTAHITKGGKADSDVVLELLACG